MTPWWLSSSVCTVSTMTKCRVTSTQVQCNRTVSRGALLNTTYYEDHDMVDPCNCKRWSQGLNIWQASSRSVLCPELFSWDTQSASTCSHFGEASLMPPSRSVTGYAQYLLNITQVEDLELSMRGFSSEMLRAPFIPKPCIVCVDRGMYRRSKLENQVELCASRKELVFTSITYSSSIHPGSGEAFWYPCYSASTNLPGFVFLPYVLDKLEFSPDADVTAGAAGR